MFLDVLPLYPFTGTMEFFPLLLEKDEIPHEKVTSLPHIHTEG